jgi:streptogramin lyase
VVDILRRKLDWGEEMHVLRLVMRIFAFSVLGVGGLLLILGSSSSNVQAKPPQSGTKNVSAGPVLSGSVRAANGTAMEGVTVSARAAGRTFTTSVFTDQQGKYLFPILDKGGYQVWAQAVGYEMARADLSLDGNGEIERNFTLKALDDFSMQLSGAEWVAALPSDTAENRRLKAIFQHTCTACHTPSFVLQNRFDEAGWMATLHTMDLIDYLRYDHAVDPVKGETPNPWIHHFVPELGSYLAKMRGPEASPMQFHPLPRPTGDAARVVITEYDIPPVQTVDFKKAATQDELAISATGMDGSNWSEGTAEALENQGTHDVVADRYGYAWVTANSPNHFRTYAKLNIKTGEVTNYKVDARGPWVANTHAMSVAPDGMIWTNVSARGFGEGTGGIASSGSLGVGRIDPKTGKMEIFDPPPGMNEVGAFVDVDGKGKVWAATLRGGLHFDPDTKKFTDFISPSSDGVNFGTYGGAGDADGNGWWAVITEDKLGMGNIKTGKSIEIQQQPRQEMRALTTEEDRKFYNRKDNLYPSINTAPLWGRSPRRIAADHTGHYVWAADSQGQDISSVDIRTLKVSYYDVPVPYSSPYDLRVDKSHNVWVSLRNADRVGKFDTVTKKWTVYKLPSVGSEIRHISVDDATGDVWGASFRTSKVFRMQFRTEQRMTAGQ